MNEVFKDHVSLHTFKKIVIVTRAEYICKLIIDLSDSSSIEHFTCEATSVLSRFAVDMFLLLKDLWPICRTQDFYNQFLGYLNLRSKSMQFLHSDFKAPVKQTMGPFPWLQ